MTIKLNAATGGGSVSLSAPNSTTSNLDVELTLPVDDGAANTFLKSDGSGTLSWASASSDNITEGNTTVECVDTGSNGHITFDTEGSEAARFDSSGRLLVGTGTARTNFFASTFSAPLQIEGAGASDRGISAVSGSTESQRGGQLILGRQRSGAVGGNTIISSNDQLGIISFQGNDGTDFCEAAAIVAQADASPSANYVPGRLVFMTGNGTSALEKMRLTREGALMAQAGGGTSYNTNDHHHILVQAANNYVLQCYNPNASVTAELVRVSSTAVQTSGRSLMKLWSGNGGTPTDTEFHLRMDGNGYADGSWNGGGADYAEFFEWSDGNTSEEDRRGISVVLDGDKIREAVVGEEPIGVISANPSVVGDTAWNSWREKYLRDDYGTSLMEDYTAYEWTDENGTKHSYPIDNVPDELVVPDDATTTTTDEQGNTLRRRILNPDYDPDVEYRPREHRPEWDIVGLMGKLRIRKGQVTGARWIKMRDISDTVEEWLVR